MGEEQEWVIQKRKKVQIIKHTTFHFTNKQTDINQSNRIPLLAY